MEITYQGLRIQLPLEGVIGVESFSMDASFNKHISVTLMLLAEEEKIESAVHGIADGDKIEVYENGRDGIFFVGKIIDIWMQKERGLCYLGVKSTLLYNGMGAYACQPEFFKSGYDISRGNTKSFGRPAGGGNY